MAKSLFEALTPNGSLDLPERLRAFREGGQLLRDLLKELCDNCIPGIPATFLRAICQRAIPSGIPYNLEISCETKPHSAPIRRHEFNENRLYSIDLSIKVGSQWVDGARTTPCGQLEESRKKALEKLDGIFQRMIEDIAVGVKFSDFCQIPLPEGCSIVEGMGGHGLGTELHSPPDYIYSNPGSTVFNQYTFFTLEPVFKIIQGGKVFFLYHESSIFLGEKEIITFP